MPLAPISDTCLLVENLEAAIVFYRDLVGFTQRRHAPGFADFSTGGVTLALWERRHMVEHVGIEAEPMRSTGRTCMIAIEVESMTRVDETCRDLAARGVNFLKPPKSYPWNAYACYFEDPDHHLWEVYAWAEGGHAGLID